MLPSRAGMEHPTNSRSTINIYFNSPLKKATDRATSSIVNSKKVRLKKQAAPFWFSCCTLAHASKSGTTLFSRLKNAISYLGNYSQIRLSLHCSRIKASYVYLLWNTSPCSLVDNPNPEAAMLGTFPLPIACYILTPPVRPLIPPCYSPCSL